jgi:glyoxylase-like metal-dependent hydrolase (beta-lactamase superfamily II)
VADPVLEGLWQFEAPHPEWTQEIRGEEGWERDVAWWALASPHGLVLIDPLVEEWTALDQLTEQQQGCAGIVRTCHWHERSVGAAAARYGVDVWAAPPEPDGTPAPDREVRDGEEIFDVIRISAIERTDEVALWLPSLRVLIFADAMIRTNAGTLRVCPESWTQPPGGHARLRALLAQLAELPVEHVLVAHGPLVLGNGAASMRTALS